MVKDGWVIAYRYYSKDYIAEEERAKKIKGAFGKVFLKNLIFGEKIISC